MCFFSASNGQTKKKPEQLQLESSKPSTYLEPSNNNNNNSKQQEKPTEMSKLTTTKQSGADEKQQQQEEQTSKFFIDSSESARPSSPNDIGLIPPPWKSMIMVKSFNIYTTNLAMNLS